jgi:hypothetical protein
VTNVPFQFDVINEQNAHNENENHQHTPIELMGIDAPNSSNENVEHATVLTPPRIIRRKPKFLIDIDENILRPMHDKMSEINCRRIVKKIWNNYFEKLNQSGRCQVVVEMIKNLKFRETMTIIGLRTSENSTERTIVRNLFYSYQDIGSKSRSKDANVTRRVLTSTIMGKEMKKSCIVRKTSKSLRIGRSTLQRALQR